VDRARAMGEALALDHRPLERRFRRWRGPPHRKPRSVGQSHQRERAAVPKAIPATRRQVYPEWLRIPGGGEAYKMIAIMRRAKYGHHSLLQTARERRGLRLLPLGSKLLRLLRCR